MGALRRFGVSMEEPLLAAFDRWLKRKGYSNRSEAVRDLAAKALVTTEAEDPQAQVAGTITLVYPYQLRLQQVQTSCHPSLLISANLQVHVDRDTCLKVLAVQGTAAAVRELADQLLGMKGVRGHLTLAYVNKHDR